MAGLLPGINNRFLFTGREYAEKFKFYEYRARAYNPELGRFMSEDPIGFKMAGAKTADAIRMMFPSLPETYSDSEFNLYRYCANDPLDKTDPMGLFTIEFDASFPESARPTVTAAVSTVRVTERGKQFNQSNIVIKVIPADNAHRTAAVGSNKLRLDPRDPAFLDPQSRRDFSNHPGELPPSDAKGRAVTVGHEIGHLVTNQKDENKAGPNNHNVRENENPIRKDLKLPERKTYDGADVNKPKTF